MPATVTVSGLTRRFGELVAVDSLDLAIDGGELFGLVGSNGAGKTTLFRILTTLLPPSSGHAVVAGFDVALEPREVRRRIGYVPQLVSSDGGLTARSCTAATSSRPARRPDSTGRSPRRRPSRRAARQWPPD